MLIQKLIVIQENPCLPACTQTLLKNKESRTLPVPKNMSYLVCRCVFCLNEYFILLCQKQDFTFAVTTSRFHMRPMPCLGRSQTLSQKFSVKLLISENDALTHLESITCFRVTSCSEFTSQMPTLTHSFTF